MRLSSLISLALSILALAAFGFSAWVPRYKVYQPLSIRELRTTNGGIAIGNLQAQIDGELKLAECKPLTLKQRAAIAELISLRGQLFSQISDYEEVENIAEQLVQEFPEDGKAYLARARARATFHKFPEAMLDLDQAKQLGADPVPLNAARASILQATAQYEQALQIRKEAAIRDPNITSLSAAATLYSDLGDTEEAQRFFNLAPQSYRDVSPFPLAWMYFQQGKMWMSQGEFSRAKEYFENAHQRLPLYATVQGHLAEVEAALGNVKRAVELLTPLAQTSEDPDYSAQLARILIENSRSAEAQEFKDRAARRYEELMVKHPEAFADHAAEFWLAAGADPQKALSCALANLEIRKTARAYELVLAASLGAKNNNLVCEYAKIAARIPRPVPSFKRLIEKARISC